MTQEALKLALEALQFALHIGFPESSESQIKKGEKAYQQHRAAITAIKEALAQPEQEPVQFKCTVIDDAHPDGVPLEKWTSPPQTQEPVAYLCENAVGHKYFRWKKPSSTYKPIPLYTTPPQRTWVGLGWLPEHKCGLHLSHNEHRDVYETIEEFYDAEDFISPEEWREAVAKDSVWVLHWYPETPIGFVRIAASTLEAIEAKVKETK